MGIEIWLAIKPQFKCGWERQLSSTFYQSWVVVSVIITRYKINDYYRDFEYTQVPQSPQPYVLHFIIVRKLELFVNVIVGRLCGNTWDFWNIWYHEA